jgi:hypothetical protein
MLLIDERELGVIRQLISSLSPCTTMDSAKSDSQFRSRDGRYLNSETQFMPISELCSFILPLQITYVLN